MVKERMTCWSCWLASGYNTTPADFAEAWTALRRQLTGLDKDPDSFPNAISTMFFHLTDDRKSAERIIDKWCSAPR